MKTLAKILSVGAIVSGSLLTSSVASADVSYNVGFVSEYYYRGIYQKNASASAGIDYEQSGFYAGAWTADVGDGLEVDGYLGYGGEVGDFSYGVQQRHGAGCWHWAYFSHATFGLSLIHI